MRLRPIVRHKVLRLYTIHRNANPSCPPPPQYYPFPREKKNMLGVIYGVLLWADMNTAITLGA